MIGDGRILQLESETNSPWRDETIVPACAYQAAAEIGDKLLSAIAQSNRIKNMFAENQAKGSGIPPKAEKWTFSEIKDGGFSGTIAIDCGTWDMARVQLWVRNQLEKTACVKLGVPSLEKYRVIMDWKGDSSKNVSIPFSVLPYQGFEVTYDSHSRKGNCIADTAFLGLDAQAAYKKAVAYIETILNDQGVVKTAGSDATAAQYRFNGYKTIQGGTKIEIFFELVQ